jgi:hypothetical protein
MRWWKNSRTIMLKYMTVPYIGYDALYRCHTGDKNSIYWTVCSPQRYPYCAVVVGLAWKSDPESYGSSSVATGRVSHAGQVKKEYPGSPGQGWA